MGEDREVGLVAVMVMVNEKLKVISRYMESALMEKIGIETCVALGEKELAARVHAFFGFTPEDVDVVHTHKADVGYGVWFRLKDGRVFNRLGEEECANARELYDRGQVSP